MTLTELTHPVDPESLMPMFDAMVDRALSRSATSENKREVDASQVSNPETEEAASAAAAGGSRNVVSSR